MAETQSDPAKHTMTPIGSDSWLGATGYEEGHSFTSA